MDEKVKDETPSEEAWEIMQSLWEDMEDDKSDTSWRKTLANDLKDVAEQLIAKNAPKEKAYLAVQALADWIKTMTYGKTPPK